MGWTTPKTWATGYKVLANDLNVQIRDQLNAIVNTAGAFVNAIVGPHAIGGATNDYTRLNLNGAFTSGGASTSAYGTYHGGALTGHSGDSAAIAGTKMGNNVVTTGNCTTIAQLWVSEPQITVGSGTVTNSASLYIEGAATEATNDHAVWVDDGNVLLDDTLICRGHVLFGPGTSAASELHVVSASGGSFVRIDSVGDTSDTGIELYKAGVRKWECVNDSAGAASVDALVFKPGGSTKFTFEQSGNLTITGALSKGSGSFNIPHPLPAKSDTHRLVHSFVESPETLLLYRGEATLVDGAAVLDMNDVAGMSAGTFELLCRDIIVFATNTTGWSSVRGSVTGCTLTLECQDATSTDTVSFLVTANRHDPHIMETSWTDEDGYPIIEPEIPEPEEPE